MLTIARSKWRGPALVAALLIVASGCGNGNTQPDEPESPPFQGQVVRLLVVDDPAMTAAIRALQGEWQARSGAELKLEEMPAGELLKAAELAADAVIYPSPLIGELAERRWLAPLPKKLADHALLSWTDIAQGLREGELHWGSQVLALPLGSRVFVCYYRADLLRQFKKQPPRTWAEYQELASFFADSKNLGKLAPPETTNWHGALEPLAEGWAGLTLLARAAAYARHRDFFSVLFDVNTMEPRIAEPPFVKALEEMIAALRRAPDAPLQLTPAEVAHSFFRGECALAIGWPTHPDAHVPSGKPKALLEPGAVGCAPLPGAAEAYNWSTRNFERVPPRSVPFVALEGRLASLCRGTKHAEATFQLLAALAGTEWGARVSSASLATAPYRGSQLNDASRWVAEQQAASADPYAQAVLQSLSTRDVVFALRIPGRREYLAALDDAVREAVAGKARPNEALSKAAQKWREITTRLGKDAQRRACENSDVRIVF